MEVDLRSWNEDGRGRGEISGRTVLVTHGYPGERVTVIVDRAGRNVLQGRPTEVLHSIPGLRMPHPCAHEFSCTGCPFLSLSEDGEAQWKEQRIAGSLAASGAEGMAFRLLRPGQPFGYRHLAKAIIGVSAGRVIWGSYRASTHELADNAGCPVLHPGLSEFMDGLCHRASSMGLPVHGESNLGLKAVVARRSRATGEMLATFVITHPEGNLFREFAEACLSEGRGLVGVVMKRGLPGDNVLLRGDELIRLGRAEIEEELLGYRHRLGPESFFQINPLAAEVLFQEAIELVPPASSALEGYAGVGALTLPLLRRTGRVHAIEADPHAAATLLRLERPGFTAEQASVPDVIAARLASGTFDVCVFDPPRRGLHDPVILALAARPVSTLVLLHCSLDAFERDSRALSEIGYALDTTLGVDQFPRTAHVEMVSRFRRRA